jgi:endonuclease V-like protein UPF0215 family
MIMKQEIRILGIDDSPFDKSKDQSVLVLGTVFRGGDFMDGLMSCYVMRDGSDATDKIIEMIQKSRFRTQLRAIMSDGIAVAGFNVLDIVRINKITQIPVIIVMRNYPDLGKIKQTLLSLGMNDKIPLINGAGQIYQHNEIHFQVCGTDNVYAVQILDMTCRHSYIPEPIRIAHIIGAGIILGESKGRA